jgi:hypothetical protein
MAEIVNLRRFRKQKLRAEAADAAERNRLQHGRSKAERQRDASEKAAAKFFLDGHRREPEKK